MASPRRQTALAFIKIFESLSVESPESLFTPTYRHEFSPYSLPPPATKTSDEFIAHLASLRKVLRAFPVTAKDIIEDEKANRVVVWATSEAHFHDHVKDDGIPADDWLYKGEYIFIFTMDPSGQKVDRVLEFLDSKATERMQGLMKRARGNL